MSHSPNVISPAPAPPPASPSPRTAAAGCRGIAVPGIIAELGRRGTKAAVVITAGFGEGEDEIYNTSYQPLAVVRAGNGYRADLHEFLAERVPGFMLPRYIEFIDAPERTEAMKRIKKPPLRVDRMQREVLGHRMPLGGKNAAPMEVGAGP